MKLLLLILILVVVISLEDRLYRKHSFKNVTYTCSTDRVEVFEGDVFHISEMIRNNKFLPLPWLRSDMSVSKWLDFGTQQQSVSDTTRTISSMFCLGSYQAITRKWNVTCNKRGEFLVEKAFLVSSDLFGQGKSTKSVRLGHKILVLPQAIELEEAYYNPRYLQGDYVTPRQLVADPFYVAGIREYTDRDPMNTIHWSATAREQKLMVRDYAYTTQQSALILLNIKSQEVEYGKVVDPLLVESAIRVCASLVDHAAGLGIPISFGSNAPITDQGKDAVLSDQRAGAEHAHDIMRLLARLRIRCVMDYTDFAQASSRQHATTDIILVTSYLDDSIIEFARMKESENVKVQIYISAYIDSESIPEDLTVYLSRRENPQKAVS